MLAGVLVGDDLCADRVKPPSVWSKCQWVLIKCVTGSPPRPDRVLVSCGRDTPIPASMSTFPSGPVRTAILPPEPSSTLTFPRNLYAVTGEEAALSLIRVTSPRASAKAWRGVSQPSVVAKPALVIQQRQKWRRESRCFCRKPMAFLLTVLRFPAGTAQDVAL